MAPTKNRVGPRSGFDVYCVRPLKHTTSREREELYSIWYYKKTGRLWDSVAREREMNKKLDANAVERAESEPK
jgi:hypothetical protein